MGKRPWSAHRTRGAEALTVGPAKILGSKHAQHSAIHSSINDSCVLFRSRRGDQQDGSVLVHEKARSCRAGARAVVFTTQPPSIRGKQAAPFLVRDKVRSSTGKGAPVDELVPPETSAPWDDITDFIRKRRVSNCFAFSIAFNPERCPFVPDHIPPGYY